MPDLISFVPSTIYGLFNANLLAQYKLNFEIDKPQWVFRWAVESYNYSHSLIIFLAVFILVSLWLKKAYWPMFGWALHILIDIFTHKNFFETPFLFPLSGFTNHHGLAWDNFYFMLINYTALATLYILVFSIYKKHGKGKFK